MTLRLWKMLYEAINDVVDQVTLADLVGWEREINGAMDFVI